MESDIRGLNIQYEKVKRENVPTAENMMTKNILNVLQGGSEGSIYGNWDFFRSNVNMN